MVVSSDRTPSSTSAIVASAVNALEPLAMPKRVSRVLGMDSPRCARPYALASSSLESRSTRTTPENLVTSAVWSISTSRLPIASG